MPGLLALLPACVLWAGGLPDYRPLAWVRGDLRCAGSETMRVLLSRWASAFAERQPGVSVEIDGRGSGAAPALLSAGGIDFAALSREPTRAEAGVGGATLVFVPVGWDTLRLLRRRDAGGPVPSFASAYSGSDPQTRPFGRNLSSGTRAEAAAAMRDGRFGPAVRSLPSPGGVEDAVAADPRAVGYGGGGARLSRCAPVGEPLRTRPLVLAFRTIPPGNPALREFLSFALSREGQELVVASGFRALDPDSAAALRRRLGLDG